MEAIAKHLLARFPILSRLLVQAEGDAPAEPLPPCFGIFLAAMEGATSTPLCFVLPRRGDIARLAVVVYALHRFVTRQQELTKDYGEANFKSGDLVRIHPSRHVFRFGGFDQDSPEFIWLRLLNGGDRDRWKVRAASFVPRLEPTTLTRPVGRMNTPIHDPIQAPLDSLLGTSTFGNQRLFRNEVVLLDSATGLDQFAGSVSLQSSGPQAASPTIKKLLPIGDVSRAAGLGATWFTKWDERNPSGEPLIAVTSSAELLARLCIDVPASSKLVISNGLSRFTDLQSFDDIRQTQRLVLFADDKDQELIGILGDRGCRFWELTAEEIRAGDAVVEPHRGIIGKLRVWARNKEELSLESVPCDQQTLEDACVRLESMRPLLDQNDEGPTTKLVGRAWRMLNAASAVTAPLDAEAVKRWKSQIDDFRVTLRGNVAWLTAGAEAILTAVADDMERLVTLTPTFGTHKGAALERLADASTAAGLRCAVLVRTETQANELDGRFRGRRRPKPPRIVTTRTLDDDADFDHIVCVSWIGTDAMQELALRLAAPRITLVGYSFERRWLQQCELRIRSRSRPYRLTPTEKQAVIGPPSDGSTTWPADSVRRQEGATNSPEVNDIWSFEQRLRTARKGSAAVPTESSDTMPSRYVSFVGKAYAFFTGTHAIVVATELLAARSGTRQRPPEKLVADLKPGDYVVFPESGERELIHEKADQLLGEDAQRLRQTARIWKDALRSGTITPDEFWKYAHDLGRPRHIVTIRNWFAESSQIGPGLGDKDLSEDLELIALVTNHVLLSADVGKVIDSIKRLRSAHLSAGVRLRDVLIRRLPEVIGQVEEDGTLIDLGELGSAWIVQVDSVASDTELRARGEVNRLLWDDQTPQFDTAF